MKNISEHRAEFEAKLANEPEKLVAYRQAMDAVAGDWVEQNMVHMQFLCMERGVPFTDDEKRKAAARGKSGLAPSAQLGCAQKL